MQTRCIIISPVFTVLKRLAKHRIFLDPIQKKILYTKYLNNQSWICSFVLIDTKVLWRWYKGPVKWVTIWVYITRKNCILEKEVSRTLFTLGISLFLFLSCSFQRWCSRVKNLAFWIHSLRTSIIFSDFFPPISVSLISYWIINLQRIFSILFHSIHAAIL